MIIQIEPSPHARGREPHILTGEFPSDSRAIPARARALRLKGVIAARAKARMLAGKPADPSVNLHQGKTRDALAGKPADPVPNLAQGKTRDVVAFVALRLVG